MSADLVEITVLASPVNLGRWVKCDAMRVEPLGDGRYALRTTAYDCEEAEDTELRPLPGDEEGKANG